MKRFWSLLLAAALLLSSCAASGGPGLAVSAQSAPAQFASAAPAQEEQFATTASSGAGEQAASAQTWTEAEQQSIPAVTGSFKVTMIHVGKADCLVLQTENHVVMVDTGLRDSVDNVLDWLNNNGVYTIDALVLSHFDKDHVGGAAQIIKNVEVKQVYQADYDGESKRYQKYVDAAAEYDVPVERVSETTDFVFDDVLFSLRPASETLVSESLRSLSNSGEPDENDCSLALAVWHGNNSFAFLGDAEDTRAAELMRQNIGPFTFVKAPHHGRLHDNTIQLFEVLQPQVVFVTCSDDDEDGNSAEPKLMKYLTDSGAEVYQSTDGTVTCISNGDSLTTHYF